MSKLSLFILLFVSLAGMAQDNPTERAKPIVAEGKLLYRSEMASWYGTDIFLERYADRSAIGGYFSYLDGETAKCVFFSKGEAPKVIGTISFDSTYDVKKANADLKERAFSARENDLYTIRKLALTEINSDTMFRSYENTDLNIIPLVTPSIKKVYVLTGPKQHGMMIIGNDYLLTFNAANELLSKKTLHKNIIPIYYGGKEDDGKDIEGAMHTHLPETGDFITATDICTLMLYSKFAKWKSHQIVSEKYLNIWNCVTNQLVVVPRDAMNNIDKQSKEGKD